MQAKGARETYIVIRAVVRLDATTFDEQEAFQAGVIAALGCDNTEENCPMVTFSSVTYPTAEEAVNDLCA